MNLNLILPVGTQIVSLIDVNDRNQQLICPQGAVGAIVEAPTDNSHAYRVRLPNRVEVMLNRHEFSIRRQFQTGHFREDLLADYNLQDCIIYRCIIGSRAYGLDTEKSDTDRRGIYLPPAELHWSLYGIPEQIENKVEQECYWELQKFILLALKANPNVLECLYTPLVETASPLALELLETRSIFLSQLIYQTYNSYVLSQFKKMEQDLRNKGHVRPKHTLHLIRLLLSGITILKEGFVPVRVEEYRSQLLAIRTGEMSWEEANAWRLSLHQSFDAAFANTRLPERPDYSKANAFLIRARKMAIDLYK